VFSVALAVAVLGGGCGPVMVARETARVTRQSVDEYDRATAAVQDAEEKFYEELADAIQEARQGQLRTELTNSRVLEARSFADYLAGNPVERATRTEVFNFLLKATNDEQALFRRLREQADSARASVLDAVEGFEKRNKEIDAVKKRLDELSQGRDPMETVKFLNEFFDGIKAAAGDKKTSN
jgi:DNA replication initiation complex subunit (GINS family)